MINDKKKDSKRMQTIISICIFVLLIFILNFFYFPSYIPVPISPPNNVDNNSNKVVTKDWKNTIYSIYEDEWSKSRYYVLRKEITYSLIKEISNDSQNKILESFDKSLDLKGWSIKDETAPCWLFIPELEQIIRIPSNGYKVYLNEKEKNSSASDFICLLYIVDNRDLRDDNFKIMLLTVRPSLFNKIIPLIFPD